MADVFLKFAIKAAQQVTGKDGTVYTHCVVNDADLLLLKQSGLLAWGSEDDIRSAPDAIKVAGKISHEFFGNPVERKPIGLAKDEPIEEIKP